MLPVVLRNKSTPWIKNKVPRNNLIGSLGDSLSVGSYSTSWENFNSAINVAPYQFYALTLPKTGDTVSQGIFLPGPTRAISGVALDYIKDTLLPLLLSDSPRPGFCLVLGGTNDVGNFVTENGVHAAQTKLRTIYQTLLSNKILPIAQGIPTIENNASFRANIINFNQHVSDLATELDIPFIDYFPITDDGVDGWITGYSSDVNVHWGQVGAAIAGQALRDSVLEPYAHYFSAVNLVTEGNDSGNGILFENGTMLDDGYSDGIPDGGQTQSQDYWYVVSGGADCTFSLVADPGVVSGKWWRINKTVFTDETYLLGNYSDPYNPVLTPGDLMECGFMCKVLNPQSTTTIQFYFYNQSSGDCAFSLNLHNMVGNIAPFKIASRFYVPSSMPKLRGHLHINGGTADVYIGQLTIRKVG